MAEKKDVNLLDSSRQAMDCLQEMSDILNTGLDAETLSICVRLCEQGVNPEALAAVITELRREVQIIQKPSEDLK